MEEFIGELLKISPAMAGVGVVWWIYNKDKEKVETRYENLVSEVRDDSKEREVKYQETIDKLVDKIDVVEVIKRDVCDIKERLNEQSKPKRSTK